MAPGASAELAHEEPPAPVPEVDRLLIVTARMHVVEAARHLNPVGLPMRDDATRNVSADQRPFALRRKVAALLTRALAPADGG